MKVFYHSDLDGYCSAAIVKSYLKEHYPNIIADFFEVDYNRKFPFSEIQEDEIVYVVDFSLDWNKLLDITKNVIWIDHHVSAIKKYENYDWIPGKREIGIAACELCWRYFFPFREVPYAIKLLGDYDVWKFELPETRFFQLGMKEQQTHLSSSLWQNLFTCFSPREKLIKEITNQGKIINSYQNKQNKKLVEKISFYTHFEDYKAICINAAFTGSYVFDSVDKKTYDIMITFYFDGKKWNISMYTENPKIDVSLIAVKYGGGGHRGAAGFTVSEFLFKEVVV